MAIIGYDAGNYESKIVTQEGSFKFRSCLGEYRDFNIERNTQPDDIIYEYNGVKGFAGKLAEFESMYPREMAGDSKAHEDAKLRILIGLHRFTNDLSYDLVVGQPIRKHRAEKERIKSMLEGRHTISINGVTKTFTIRNVAVAPEGAGAYWAYRGTEAKLRIIDVGSGTVNCASVIDGTFNDRDSFTLTVGTNSEENVEVARLAEAIIARSSKRWSQGDSVRVCGGIAEKITPYLKKHFTDINTIQPMIRVGHNAMKGVEPAFANAAGFYELARDLYGGA